MMRSIGALPLALAALLLQMAMAAPAPYEGIVARSMLEGRAEAKALAPIVVGLYICTGPQWTGTCAHLLNSPGLCSEWTAPEPSINVVVNERRVWY